MHDTIETILKELLLALGLPGAKINRVEAVGQVIFSIDAGDHSRQLIGMHGDTVHALDFLVKKIAEKRLAPPTGEGRSQESEPPMFLIDVNDYRTKQIKDLETKALMMAERARSFQYDVELTPMSGYERLIIHTALQNAPNVKTESQGEGRSRRVVIKYSADA
jgi:spoIIIJ-associated protein